MTKILALIASLLLTTSVYAAEVAPATAETPASETTKDEAAAHADKDKKEDKKPADEAKK